MIIYSEGATKAQEAEANIILDILTVCYPGHPWAVRVYDGGFFIRHLAFPSNWGMNFREPTGPYSASALKREIVMMAGEWLERAGMARGRHDPEQEIERVEGVPEKFQPHREVPQDVNVVIEPSSGAVRETPRPQALKALTGETSAVP